MKSTFFLLGPAVAVIGIVGFFAGIVVQNALEDEPYAPLTVDLSKFIVRDSDDGDSEVALLGKVDVSYEICAEEPVTLVFNFILARLPAEQQVPFSTGALPWEQGCHESFVDDVQLPGVPCELLPPEIPAEARPFLPCGMVPGEWIFTGTFTVVEPGDTGRAQTVPVKTEPFTVVE